MYRKPAIEPQASPPREMTYAPRRSARLVWGRRFFLALGLALAVSGWIAVARGRSAVPFYVTAPISILAGLWRPRRPRRPPPTAFRLTVEHDALVVRGDRDDEPIARVELAELANVSLETTEVERVLENDSPVAAVRLSGGSIAAVEHGRVVLEPREGRSIRLGDEFHAKFDVIESLGEIRRFLRKNGWVPLDEREVSSPPAASTSKARAGGRKRSSGTSGRPSPPGEEPSTSRRRSS